MSIQLDAMVILRFFFRLIVFLLGIGAIGVVIIGGFVYLRDASDQPAIVVAADTQSVGRAPETVEDVALQLWLQARVDEINTSLSDDPALVSFNVAAGESAQSVAERLQEMGMISDAELFRRYLSYNQLDVSLEAGDYQLRRNMNMPEIGQALQQASTDEVSVTIREGWRAEEIAQYLSDENIMDGNEFLAMVRDGTAVEHTLLFDRPLSQGYEGYLFPDTYRLTSPARPEALIQRMLDNMASKLPANTFDLATQRGLSFYQVLTVASIVEREAAAADERPIIASVYLNRLAPGSTEPYLNADPTVQYAMGYQADSGQWWKTPVSLEEYSTVSSPYNTYINPGLPPGPIANPGIRSIEAVLQPTATTYLYFVCQEPNCANGRHVFATTYEEHQRNVATYQGQ